MAHIALNNDFPGMLALQFHKPRIGRPLNALAQAALRGPSPLTPGERELIAAYVSNLNECNFCCTGHGAIAGELLEDGATVTCTLDGKFDEAGLTPKMRALLAIAAKVREDGRKVTHADVDAAKAAGATDDDIHDAVLVAAFFCFANRYVDGLDTPLPEDDALFGEAAKHMAKFGYQRPSRIGRFFVSRMVRRYRTSTATSTEA